MKRLFIITLATAVTLAASLGAFLFFSLWPYYTLIGRFTAGVVITGCICLAALMVAFTYNKIGQWHATRRHAQLLSNVVVAGEIVAMVKADGSFIHLSAMHESARHPAQIMAPRTENTVDAVSDDETVIEFYNEGMTYETIMEATNLKYNKVQRIIAEAKKAGKIAR